MNTTGTTTKSTFLNVESHKLHEEFEVEGLKHTLAFSAALVTANDFDIDINGNAIATVPFNTDSDTTMIDIAASLLALPSISNVNVIEVPAGTSNDRVIEVTPIDQNGISITSPVISNGASQATIAIATINGKVYQGQLVSLNPLNGKVQPTSDNNQRTCIGICIHDAVAGDLATVAVRGYAVIQGKSNGALTPGAVLYHSYDAVEGYNNFTQAGISDANYQGWALDAASASGEIVRVLLRS